MADLAVTSSVGIVDSHNSEIYSMVPDVQLAAGDVTYSKTNGKAAKALATTAPTTKRGGIALEKASVRGAVSVLKRGKVTGFNVSAMAYGDLIYISDTAGKLSTTAGTTSVVVGAVVPMSDQDLTKVAYLDFPWLT